MALSDQWTLSDLRVAARRVIVDPSGRFWSDTELNIYINQWQDILQQQFEFTWSTSTTVTISGTSTLSSIAPNLLRLDAVYWNEYRLNGRSTYDMDNLQREWRVALSTTGSQPNSVVQLDRRTLSLWPPPLSTGTLILEYPAITTLTSDNSHMTIPAWTKYNCKDFVAWKCYLREGPANSPTKALRYKARFNEGLKRFRTIYANYFPSHTLRLQPAASYEWDILLARGSVNGSRSNAMAQFTDETPTGTVNGINLIFTISATPTQLILTVDGLVMTDSGIDYTLVGTTITFVAGRAPSTSSVLRAYIYRA